MPWDEMRQRVIFYMRIIQPQRVVIDQMYTKKKKKKKKTAVPKLLLSQSGIQTPEGIGCPVPGWFRPSNWPGCRLRCFNVAVLYRGTFTLSFEIDKLGHAMGHAICRYVEREMFLFIY